jgi:ATP-binding cassette subfamily B protein
VYLFDGTIRENVRHGRADATDAEVEHAAAVARVDEIVARLADGWETRVGEGGATLSGGERQRISIARALLKDAPVLLLDEATSAVDPENEAAILDALGAGAARRTVLLVAHRLTTIERADQIVFLDEGRVVEQGTPGELLAAGGRFAAYWNDRTASRRWTLLDEPGRPR